MAENNISANGTSKSVEEIRQWYMENKSIIETFAKKESGKILRDVTKTPNIAIPTTNKSELKSYFENIGTNEKNLRKVSRYLYYRSNIYYRLINWYASMWDLKCRKVVPQYSFSKTNNDNQILKQYENTLEVLDIMNLQNNMTELLINAYVDDVCYAVTYYDDTGMFFYRLDPDECMISGRYSTGDYSYAVDMSKWKNAKRQKIIEFLGEPFSSMYREYESSGNKWIQMPEEYSMCLKFRTDNWETVIPPFVGLFLQMAGIEDLVDIQADADALSVYKLIYLPMKVLSSTKESDDFSVSPALAYDYFQKLSDAIPDDVAAAIVPGDELKTIDFSKSVDSDTTSVEKATNQILQTAGGGAVINSTNITSNAAFEAWLQSETEFAMSTLMPQINGFVNRFLSYKVSKPCKVEHFEVSVYTKDKLAEKLLESCQYSYSYRLAYGTLLGISERETLAMLYLENNLLKLQDTMIYPLSSSFTSSGKVGEGAPEKDAGDLSESGDRDRNR